MKRWPNPYLPDRLRTGGLPPVHEESPAMEIPGEARPADRPPSRRNRRRMRPRLLHGLVLGGIAAVGVAAALLLPNLFSAFSVELEGLRQIPRAELLAAAGVDSSTTWASIDLAAIEAGLRRHPGLRDVSLQRNDNVLRVGVVEREPMILVAAQGPVAVADRDGTIYRRVRPGERLDLPVATGLAGDEPPPKSAALLTEAITAAHAYAALGLEPRHGAVTEVRVHPVRGLTLYAGSPPVEIRLGFGGYREKLARLPRVWRALSSRRARPGIVHLDTATADRVAVRPLPAVAASERR